MKKKNPVLLLFQKLRIMKIREDEEKNRLQMLVERVSGIAFIVC